jgi:RNA recognition motif-containing protein
LSGASQASRTRPVRLNPGTDEKGCAITTKLYVGNLSFGTTEAAVRELFAQAGEVVSVSLPTDRETGRPRGFGFVELASEEAAVAATQRLDGYSLDGRNIRVNSATERTSGAGSGFGRGFGPNALAQRPSRPKGSRRNVRARKRSVW